MVHNPSHQERAAAGNLARVEVVDCSDAIAEIQRLFVHLAYFDPRFGENGYPPADAQADPRKGGVSGTWATYEGWRHPALLAYYQSKGYRDRHDLSPHDLAAIAFNLRKKLAQFQQEDQQ